MLSLASGFPFEAHIFVAFTLAPVLVIIWSISPDLWGCLSSSASYVGEDPTNLLHLLKDLPGCAQDLLATGENLVKSLTCDDLAFSSPNSDHVALSEAGASVGPRLLEVESPFPKVKLPSHNLAPMRTLWLLSGMILMGLDSYFPQLSHVSPLWTPVQAVIPVLH
ncbi:hypothetical protein DSO57_1006498 [Entomophthora muscae]|uniref:Uncharacterized protein n=1 Tax=Entomophthora muscae TaxID=34485 RepID=A0ACC2RME5_9FUNG|nr:hypothetical protein DSO57_1006498 [Entomophthora muscae]